MLVVVMTVSLSGIIGVVRPLGAAGISRLDRLVRGSSGAACARPCPLGIRPGTTTLPQAVELLRRHPEVLELAGATCKRLGWCEFTLKDGALGILRADADGLVQEVYLSFHQPGSAPPALGDFFTLLGMPIGLKHGAPDGYGFLFHFPGMDVQHLAQIETGAYRLCPESPVLGMRFYVSVPGERPLGYWDRWQGFASLARYSALAEAEP